MLNKNLIKASQNNEGYRIGLIFDSRNEDCDLDYVEFKFNELCSLDILCLYILDNIKGNFGYDAEYLSLSIVNYLRKYINIDKYESTIITIENRIFKMWYIYETEFGDEIYASILRRIDIFYNNEYYEFVKFDDELKVKQFILNCFENID